MTVIALLVLRFVLLGATGMLISCLLYMISSGLFYSPFLRLENEPAGGTLYVGKLTAFYFDYSAGNTSDIIVS